MIIRSKKEQAQGLAEYAIIAAIVLVAMIGVTSMMSPSVHDTVDDINGSLKNQGMRLVLADEEESGGASTPLATAPPTPTPRPESTATSVPLPTATSTPLPTPVPTDDGCAELQATYSDAVDAYAACGGGWRCWSQYRAVLDAYVALRNAGCE